MFFTSDKEVELHDIAVWVGKKDVQSLTMGDIKKVVPENIWENCTSCPFVLVHKKDPYITSTWKQRLNRVWVVPVYVVVIGPILYIKTGHWGVSPYSKMGEVLSYLIGG